MPRAAELVAPLDSLVLPFTVKIVQTEEQLSKAVGIHAETYGRHHPDIAANLKAPETADREACSLVLVACRRSPFTAEEPLRMDHHYLKLGFSDVYPCGRLAIIASSGTIPVRVLSLESVQVERWF